MRRLQRCRCVVWLEHRPWVGYYIAVLVTLDFLIHLLEQHLI